MNAKKAKHLRAVARKTIIAPTSYQPMRPFRIFAPLDLLQKGSSAIWLGQCVLDPNCTKAHYQQLKRAA